MKMTGGNGMIIEACHSCGTVVDLTVLLKNKDSQSAFNQLYVIDGGKYFWQCRSCHSRNEVMNENILRTIKASAKRVDKTNNSR